MIGITRRGIDVEIATTPTPKPHKITLTIGRQTSDFMIVLVLRESF